MKYYSTNKQASDATLEEAVVRGLAGDKAQAEERGSEQGKQTFHE